jgi:hypothetical protein
MSRKSTIEVVNADPLLDERAAAPYLGDISVRALQDLRRRGNGPGFLKVGRLVRYRRSALDEWLKSRERRSTSDTSGAAA